MLSEDQRFLGCSGQLGEPAMGWSLLCCSQSHLLSPEERPEIPRARLPPGERVEKKKRKKELQLPLYLSNVSRMWQHTLNTSYVTIYMVFLTTADILTKENINTRILLNVIFNIILFKNITYG